MYTYARAIQTVRMQIGNCEVGHAALEDVESRAVAAEEALQRAEAALSRQQADDTTGALSAEMKKLEDGIIALRKVR